jgi:hypothetical protein
MKTTQPDERQIEFDLEKAEHGMAMPWRGFLSCLIGLTCETVASWKLARMRSKFHKDISPVLLRIPISSLLMLWNDRFLPAPFIAARLNGSKIPPMPA